nr:hypothetical protein [Actinomadura madurae]
MPTIAPRHRQPRALGRQRDPEVDQARAVRRQQHVRRLEVAVHHTRGVHALQRLRERGAQSPDRPVRQGAVRVDRGLQRQPRHVLGGQPWRRPARVGVHHGGGEGTAHAAGRLDLPDEPAPEPRILRQLGPHRLHRDRAAPRRRRQEDLAHPAAAEPADEPVRPELLRVARLQRRVHLPAPHQRASESTRRTSSSST